MARGLFNPRVVFHTDMAERVCEEGTQVTQEPAGPDYTTWGQVWDDMRDENWYADSFRPGRRCSWPRHMDRVVDDLMEDNWWYLWHNQQDLGYHQTDYQVNVERPGWPAPIQAQPELEHAMFKPIPHRDPEVHLGTVASMNNWRFACDYDTHMESMKLLNHGHGVRNRRRTVRAQQHALRRTVRLALQQVA